MGPAISIAVSRFLKWRNLEEAFESLATQYTGRERDRAARAFKAAIDRIGANLARGDSLRDDGFFDERRSDDPKPSDAEEILEGVLRAAVESAEQRKADRLGELYAYIASNSAITPGHANYLIALVRRLTYQQLLFLGLFSQDHELDWEPDGAFTHREVGVMMSLFELAREGLLTRKDRTPILTYGDISLSELQTSLNGKLLVEAMSLTEAEPEDGAALGDVFSSLAVLFYDEGTTALEVLGLPGTAPDSRIPLHNHRVVERIKRTVELDDLPPADADNPKIRE